MSELRLDLYICVSNVVSQRTALADFSLVSALITENQICAKRLRKDSDSDYVFSCVFQVYVY